MFEREGKNFLYASLTNGFVELSQEIYDFLRKSVSDEVNDELCSGGKCVESVIDEEDIATLRRLKAVDVDDDLELEKIRFRHYSSLFNPMVLTLTINPTLSCNFRCKYCFEKDHRNEFMTEDVENDIVSFVKSHNSSKLLDVTWFGGEPLLAFNTICHLSERLIPIKERYNAGMITNGYLLTPEICREMKNLKISRMQITVDGNENTHNKRRFIKGGAGTYKRIIENIDMSQRVAPEVRICVRVNVDLENADEFIDVYKYFERMHYPNVVVTPGFVVDIDKSGTSMFCAMDDASTKQFLVRLSKEHGVYNNDFYPHGRTGTCGACRTSALVIGPKGELYRCWNDVGNKDREYGTIKGEITNEKVLYQYLGAPDQFSDQECLKCKLLPVCSGGCPYHRIMSHAKGTKYNSCPLVKSNLDDFLWMHYCEKTHKKFEPIK